MSKPLCVIQGPVFNRSGYGDLATDLAKSLVRYGKYDVKINPTTILKNIRHQKKSLHPRSSNGPCASCGFVSLPSKSGFYSG